MVGVILIGLVYFTQKANQARRETWRRLAAEINGQFDPHGPRVQMHVKEWTITLDRGLPYEGRPSNNAIRIRAPYTSQDGFQFIIYRGGFLTAPMASMGMPVVKSGNPEFDAAFRLKATDESKARALLSNPKIRDLICAQPPFRMLGTVHRERWMDGNLPEGIYELYFVQLNGATDLGQLKETFELFTEMLNQLAVIGSASEKNPQCEP